MLKIEYLKLKNNFSGALEVANQVSSVLFILLLMPLALMNDVMSRRLVFVR